ncbi:hypothetical protein GcM3_082031 [Golovinomyces cichoracearum]|uniref:Uncharacterized protein n=1 Tax=Golovinomyces cichoracearum TaxID=62708 RepID=A0A420IMJ7_9PEZI|nr:hypothetical protein GcM3_082031 [Golovinomyces cichoracearum]
MNVRSRIAFSDNLKELNEVEFEGFVKVNVKYLETTLTFIWLPLLYSHKGHQSRIINCSGGGTSGQNSENFAGQIIGVP